MAILRLIVLATFILPTTGRLICQDSTNPNCFSFGASLSKSLVGALNRNINTEFFGRYRISNTILKLSLGYDKMSLDIPHDQTYNTPYALMENEMNRLDGYFLRLGVLNQFTMAKSQFKKPLKLSAGVNVVLNHYRQKIKLKYYGYYIDNVYSYNYFTSYCISMEPELNVALYNSKNGKITIESNNRFGLFLVNPKYGIYTTKLPGINHILLNRFQYSLFNLCLYYKFREL